MKRKQLAMFIILLSIGLTVQPLHCKEEFQKIIHNHYFRFKTDVLNKDQLKSPEEYFSSPSENRGFEALGLVGSEKTVRKLEKLLRHTKRLKMRFSMIFSLIMLGKKHYIGDLVSGLKRKLPDYHRWLEKGEVPLNSNTHCAALLRKLSEYGVLFEEEHINGLIDALGHEDTSVVSDARFALNQIFGFWFVSGEDWVRKSYEKRKKYIDAWKKFWSENSGRTSAKMGYSINGLALGAELKTFGNNRKLVVRLKNMSMNPLALIVRKSGESGFEKKLQENGFAVIAGGKMFFPERKTDEGIITLKPQETYTEYYSFKVDFPELDMRPVGKITVSYSYYGKHQTCWKGEVRSLPVEVK